MQFRNKIGFRDRFRISGNDAHVEAKATFELDIRKLGLSAPRFLMIKMEDEVTASVTVTGAVLA